MSSSSGPDIVTDGLVLSLDAANRISYPGSGTTWFDRSGNSNNGILANGPTFSGTNVKTIVFDGTNDYVDCGNIMPSTAYTKCVFFKVFDLAAANNLVSGGGGGTHYFYGASSSYLRAGHFNGGELTSNTAIFTNTWYHGAVTFSTTLGFSMYQNGVNVGNLLATNSFLGGNMLLLGSYAFGYFLNGLIPSVQIYNRVLTSQEILQNYNVTKSRFGL